MGEDVSDLVAEMQLSMDDTVKITHPGPVSTADLPIDPDTFEVVDSEADATVYEGKALLAMGFRSFSSDVVEGGVPVAMADYRLHLPLSAPVPREGDVVEITECVRDAALEGRKLIVQTVSLASYAGSRLIGVEEPRPTRARAV
jgi:hypothetical protein